MTTGNRTRAMLLAATFAALILHSANAAQRTMTKPEFAIAIHGGAGIEPDKIPTEEKRATEQALGKALNVGRKILAEGGTSLDAVEQTIRALEDDPLFNAGRGAVFNSAGMHELDASIMDGATHKGGGGRGHHDREESDFARTTGNARNSACPIDRCWRGTVRR